MLTHGPGLHKEIKPSQTRPLRSSLWPTVAADQTWWALLRTNSCSTDTACTENNKGNHESQHLKPLATPPGRVVTPFCRRGHLSLRGNQHSGNAHCLTLAPNFRSLLYKSLPESPLTLFLRFPSVFMGMTFRNPCAQHTPHSWPPACDFS